MAERERERERRGGGVSEYVYVCIACVFTYLHEFSPPAPSSFALLPRGRSCRTMNSN
jgi:hypothetical protein